MAVSKITSSDVTDMKNKSVEALPDNPSAQGYSATQIKKSYTKPLFDDTKSIVAHINRIVDEVNEKTDDIDESIEALETDIETEETARASADTNLQSQITTNANAIASETTNRQNADATLESTLKSWANAQFYTQTQITTLLGSYQALLVSGTNIKTINGVSILGSGNITIEGGSYDSGTGISIANNTISVDTSIIATISYVQSYHDSSKQDAITSSNKLSYNLLKDTPNIPQDAEDVGALADTTKYGKSITLSLDSTNYKITAILKDQDGNTLGTSNEIDLPIESVVVNGSYDNTTKKITLTMQSGSTLSFSVADLVSGLQSEITSSNKLSISLISFSGTSSQFIKGDGSYDSNSYLTDAIGNIGYDSSTHIIAYYNKASSSTPHTIVDLDNFASISNGVITIGGVTITPITTLSGYATESYVTTQLASYQTIISASNKIPYSYISGTPTIPTIDQTYSASSTNAQSGVAVASAISGKASINDSSTTSTTETWSASKINGLIGDVESLINAL